MSIVGSSHAIAAGQFYKQAGMVQVCQAMRYAFCIELLKSSGNGCVKPDFLSCRQDIAQVLKLNRHACPGRKVALHHALAVHLQDTAVGKSTGDRFFDLGHIRTTAFAQQQGFRYGTNGDTDDHLVGQLG